jgi:O-antigen/teichoic acid export membrane protein
MKSTASTFRWHQFHKVIVMVAGFLVGTSVITSALGFVFWWIAARAFPPQIVGSGAASISAMLLLSNLSTLGVGTTLIRELPRQRHHAGQLIVTGICTVGVMGLVTGVVGAIAMSYISPGLAAIAADKVFILIFPVGVSLSAVSMSVDSIFTGQLMGQMQFARNAMFALTKLLALLAISIWVNITFDLNILACWIAGVLISLAAILVIARARGMFTRLYRPRWTIVRSLARKALGNHALSLELMLPSLAMPVVVAAILAPADTAFFYTAANITGFIFYAPFALAISLYAVGASSLTAIGKKARFTLGLAMLMGILANIALDIGAVPILSFFGKSYADQGVWAMRIMALGVFPLIFKDHYVSLCRIRGRVRRATIVMFFGSASEIALAIIGGKIAGLAGVAVGWNVALGLEAMVMAPGVLRVLAQSEPFEMDVSQAELALEQRRILSELDTVVLPTITRFADPDTMELPSITRQVLQNSFSGYEETAKRVAITIRRPAIHLEMPDEHASYDMSSARTRKRG